MSRNPDMSSITELLSARESPRVDFKRDASSPEKIVHDVGAFANTAGGTIIVGVDDDGTAVGVDDPQSVEATIAQAVHDRTDPSLSPPIGFHTTDSGAELVVVRVHFYEGPDPVRIKTKKGDWRVYERISSVSEPVDDRRAEQMRRERRGTDTYDQLPAALDMSALDTGFATEAFTQRGLTLDDALMQTSEIAREVNGELRPTNAGLLLFGHDPQAVHQDAWFRCARYGGLDKTNRIDDSDLKHGPLLKLLADAERFIASYTGRVEVGVTGLQVDSIPHYSPVVVREILVNAIAHADYEIGGVFSLQIFNDRMEITNPGRWFRGMSEEQLRNGISQPRNRAIVNSLRRLEYVQQSGSAWDKAQAELSAHGYPLPRWEELGYVIRATIPIHPRAGIATSPPRHSGEVNGEVSGDVAKIPGRGATARRRLAILREVAVADGLKRGDIADRIGVALRTLDRDVEALDTAELMRFEGAPKNGVYRVTEAGKAAVGGGSGDESVAG